MKSKPLVMDHFSTVHTSFVLDFRFTNNITILTGDYGTGKRETGGTDDIKVKELSVVRKVARK
jgi:hypothetical protein